MELAQVLECRNGVSRGFLEVFSTADAMLFERNAHKTGNNAVENVPGVPGHHMVRTFHRSKPLNICIQCHSKLGSGCFTIFFDGAYFLLAVMVEGDESSRRFWSATGPY